MPRAPIASAVLLIAASLLLGGRCDRTPRTCVQTGGDTWGGDVGFVTSGNLTWSCGTPSAIDHFVLTGAVHIDRQLGAPAGPLTGSITVRSGGALHLGAGDRLYTDFQRSSLSFESGSDGTWQGNVSPPFPAVATITFPTPTTIRLDFRNVLDPDGDDVNENAMPWRLCNSRSEDCSSDQTSIHAEDTDLGERTPATYLYVDWEKFSPALETSVYSPGSWLRVVDVVDLDPAPGGDLDTIVVEAPRIGADNGTEYMGAATGYDGEGRCSECIDDAGAPASRSIDGGVLRHAVGEAQWTLAAQPFERVENAGGEVRWEVHLDPAQAPFTHHREFEGWLACKPEDQTTFDPTTEVWCARIIKTLADHHGGTGESFVVWNSPVGVLQGGDVLNVYFVRPDFGDTLLAENPAEIHGGSDTILRVDEGSKLCVTNDCTALRLDQLGPDNSEANRGQNSTFWSNLHGGFRGDLWLIESFGGRCLSPGSVCATAIKLDADVSGAAPFHDYQLSRITIQAPDADCYDGSAADDTRFCARGIMTETASAADPHRDGTFRKIRVDFVGTAWGGGVQMQQCKGGFALQDALFIGDRNVSDRADQQKSEELMELRGEQNGCNVDRVALVGHLFGIPTILRCTGCSGTSVQKWVTSLVVFGQAPASGNPNGNANAAIVADQSTFLDHGVLANFATDGFVEAEVPIAYGTQLDHWQSGFFFNVPGWGGCRHAVGLYRIGGAAQSGGSRVLFCDEVSSPLTLFKDNYLTNLVLADPGTRVLSDTYPSSVHRITAITNSLFGFAAETSSSTIFRGPSVATRSIVLDRLWHVDPRDGMSRLVAIDAPPASLGFGPNVYTNTDGECSGAVPFQDTQACIVDDAFAPAGDGVGRTGMVEGAGFAGEFDGDRVGEDVRITGLGGAALPASCTNADAPAPGAVQACGPAAAGPSWAGIVAYDWPFAWATLHPVPLFRKPGALPDPSYVPAYLWQRAAALAAQADASGDPSDPGGL